MIIKPADEIALLNRLSCNGNHSNTPREVISRARYSDWSAIQVDEMLAGILQSRSPEDRQSHQSNNMYKSCTSTLTTWADVLLGDYNFPINRILKGKLPLLRLDFKWNWPSIGR